MVKDIMKRKPYFQILEACGSETMVTVVHCSGQVYGHVVHKSYKQVIGWCIERGLGAFRPHIGYVMDLTEDQLAEFDIAMLTEERGEKESCVYF